MMKQKATVTIDRCEVTDTDSDTGQIGIRARAVIQFPYGADTIEGFVYTPGIWGVEDDAPEDYKAELYAEERGIMLDMLKTLRTLELPTE